MIGKTIMTADGLTKRFVIDRSHTLTALDHVNLDIAEGETLGLVGESGSGKSTFARCVLQLLAPSDGGVRLDGRQTIGIRAGKRRAIYRDMQMVFQDPNSSLNPRMSVRQMIAEPLRRHLGIRDRAAIDARVGELLTLVGLTPAHGARYPHELSGGQRQRIGIARALAVEPRIILLDEPTASLDVSVRAQILDLLQDLQSKLNLSYVLISHDLHVVKYMAHRVAVMYLGEIVEQGDIDDVFDHPIHPYTRALLSAAPEVAVGRKRERLRLVGEIPSPINLGEACRLYGRCPIRQDSCATSHPNLVVAHQGRLVRCPVALAGADYSDSSAS